jgi:hypothetical protein
MGSKPQEIHTLVEEMDTKSSETQDPSFVSNTLDQDITSNLLRVYNTPHILQYTAPTTERILSMTAQNHNKQFTPFLQCIQLLGNNGATVHATGQVDNGAMRNCILKQ